MTYGWAILVVLIALSVLFYLGVFDSKVQNKCTATAPVVCIDVILKDINPSYATLNLGIAGGSANVLSGNTLGLISSATASPPTVNYIKIDDPSITNTLYCSAPSPNTLSNTPTEKNGIVVIILLVKKEKNLKERFR